MSLDSYYTLGRSGLRVSRLALGAMTFGENWGWGADERTARAMFDRYLAAGGNFVDTADLYTEGQSESLLGRFIADSGSRDRVVLASKFSYNAEPGNPNAGGNGRKNILRAVEGSLRRLGTDYLDLYLLHTWDRVTPAEEVLRTLDDLVRAGKIRYAGLSDVPAWYAAQIQTLAQAHHLQPLVNLQLQYSLVERNIEREYVSLAQELGYGITAWSPLGMGLLSGKYRPSESGRDGAGDGRIQALKGSGLVSLQDKFTPRNWAIVGAVEQAAREHRLSMAQVAIQWAARRPSIGSVILGARTLEQFEDNLAALDRPLPDEALRTLDEVSALPLQFPYSFFEQAQQERIHGGVAVGDKPQGYRPPVSVAAAEPGAPGLAVAATR
ncbi:oxidoreductase [Dorcoceras hygrometricum]|uniref:Oxidoreductase n=1 Tax=Dorcoceras hygrometricum TaxID=472368 RepID=A0A2Z7A1X3_9LAMI|nr:oxidoreductase [Dorcoceras hygrometricum]